MTYWMALQLAKHYGWGEDGVTIVTLGGETAAIIAAFKTHLVDADIGGSPVAFSMEEQKVGRFLIPVSDYLGNMSSDTVFASKKLIAEQSRRCCGPSSPAGSTASTSCASTRPRR